MSAKVDDPAVLAQTEALNESFIQALRAVLPPNTGYVLTTFPADETTDGVVTYASNVEWSESARRLRQLANNLDDERAPRVLGEAEWGVLVEKSAGLLQRLVHSVTWDPNAAVTILALVMGITTLVDAAAGDDETTERVAELVDEVFHLVNSMFNRGVDMSVRFSAQATSPPPDEAP